MNIRFVNILSFNFNQSLSIYSPASRWSSMPSGSFHVVACGVGSTGFDSSLMVANSVLCCAISWCLWESWKSFENHSSFCANIEFLLMEKLKGSVSTSCLPHDFSPATKLWRPHSKTISTISVMVSLHYNPSPKRNRSLDACRVRQPRKYDNR